MEHPANTIGTLRLSHKNGEISIALFQQHPSGTHKISSSWAMIKYLDKKKLKVAMEASSGNTAIELAKYANTMGILLEVFVPNSMPENKMSLLRKAGKKNIKINNSFSSESYRSEARKYASTKKADHSFIFLDQTCNPNNPKGHEQAAKIIHKNEISGVAIAGGTYGATLGWMKHMKNVDSSAPRILIEIDKYPHAYKHIFNDKIKYSDEGKHRIGGLGAKDKPFHMEEASSLATELIVANTEWVDKLYEYSKKLKINIGPSSVINVVIAYQRSQDLKKQIGTIIFDHISHSEKNLTEDFNFSESKIIKLLESDIARKKEYDIYNL